MMGDRGAHTLTPVFWALKLGLPTSVTATSCGLNEDTHPLSAIVTYQFPGRANLPPVKLTWYEGTRAPRPEGLEDGRIMGDAEGGVIFKGSKGALMCGTYGGGPRFIPEALGRSYQHPSPTLPRLKGNHVQNWIAACKQGVPAGSDFATFSGPLTEVCLLGNIAKRVDGRIDYDAANMKITNNPDANKYVQTEYRQGWSL